jgi:hypothetical protein
MSFDTVLTQFSTKTKQNEKFPQIGSSRKFVEVV